MPPTTDQWRDLLLKALAVRQPAVEKFTAYYDGAHTLAFATAKFKEAFGELFSEFSDNWCALVVDGAAERLSVQGFRFGEDDADEEAWHIWQTNALDAKSLQGHTEAIKTGTAYVLVGPPEEPGGEPQITIEHPGQFIVAPDPRDRRRRLAALKTYRDADGAKLAVLYLPDSIVTYRMEPTIDWAGSQAVLGLWLPGDLAGPGAWQVADIQPNPVGRVLGVPLENNPTLLHGGTSDLRPAISLNDAVNKFLMDMIHASEYVSFPQRVLTGVELPTDPITGDVLPEAQVRAAASRLWAFEDPNARVFDLPVGTLSNYVEGIDLCVQHIAAQTRTPPHYLLAKLANLSGDALKAAETGLVARCRRKMIDFSDSWEEVMRLAFAWRAIDRQGWAGADEDQARSRMESAETIWMNPESRDNAALGNELVLKQQVGVPQVVLWEEAGYSPQQIKRMQALKREDTRTLQEAQAQPATGTDGPSLTSQSTPGGLQVTGLPAPPPPEAAPTNGGSKSVAPQQG